MVEHCKVIKNRATFTADTDDMPVDVPNLKELVFGFDMVQNGATPPTLAQLIAHTNEVKVTVGGEVTTLVKMADLFVLNHLWLKHRPFYIIGANDGEIVTLENVKLPLEVTTDKEIKCKLSYTGHATVDTEVLTLIARFKEKAYSRRPFNFKYITGTIATTEKEWDIAEAGKTLLGLLFYMTTIPTTSLDSTIGELKILQKRTEKYHRHILTMRGREFEPEDTTIGGILDNYALLKLPEPYPADSLKLRMKSLVSAVDAFRAIGIYR